MVQLNTYGGRLRYFVYHVPDTAGGEAGAEAPVPVPDVVIQGNGARLEYFSRKQFFSRENVSVEVRLHESEGERLLSLSASLREGALVEAAGTTRTTGAAPWTGGR